MLERQPGATSVMDGDDVALLVQYMLLVRCEKWTDKYKRNSTGNRGQAQLKRTA